MPMVKAVRFIDNFSNNLTLLNILCIEPIPINRLLLFYFIKTGVKNMFLAAEVRSGSGAPLGGFLRSSARFVIRDCAGYTGLFLVKQYCFSAE